MTVEELKMKGLLGWSIAQSNLPYGLVLYILSFLLAGVAGYLLGSVNCSLLISRIGYRDDIRTHGSGNAGMTNVMRTYGKKAAALTLLGDALKAALAVFFGFLCCGTYSAYFAGLLCAVGHAYPIFFGFKGGKGVVVTAAVVLCLNPFLFLLLLIIFIAIVASTKYISLGSIMCMLLYPLLHSSLGEVLGGKFTDTTDIIGIALPGGRDFTVLIAFLNAAFVIWLHRSNIKRLMEGTENKFSFKKSVKRPDAASAEGKRADPTQQNGDVAQIHTDENAPKTKKGK